MNDHRHEELDMIIRSCGLYEHEGMLCRHALKVSKKQPSIEQR
jgi:hypothetical protein